MKPNTRYELRPRDVQDRYTGFFKDNLYYEHSFGRDDYEIGKLVGNKFFYNGGTEPAGTLEGLTLTRLSDGVKFLLFEVANK